MALETRFWISRRSSRRSERTTSEHGTIGQLQPLAHRDRRELHRDLAQQFVDAEGGEFRPQHAGVEPRDVEQRAEDFLHRFQRGVDIVDQRPIVGAALALDQAGDVKPRRVQRLQYVVAGGGQELGLGNVGGVGLALGARQRRVELVSSSVRSCTRRSSDSLARSSASAASTLAVMSVKVVTMPPSGMRLARTSIARSGSAKRSRNGSLPESSARADRARTHRAGRAALRCVWR